MKILVIGDSHTRSLKKAKELRPVESSHQMAISIHWLMRQKVDRVTGDLPKDEAFTRIATLDKTDLLAISLAGTYHNIFGLLRHERAFDFFDVGTQVMSSYIENVEVIPERILWDVFYSVVAKNKDIVTFANDAMCPVYHLSTPPPKADSQFMEQRMVRYRDQVVSEVGLNPPEMRLRLWKLEMRVLEKLCNEWAITLLPPPQGTQTPEGFLKPEYYADDATHANATYGERVLRQLEGLSLENLQKRENG